MRSEYKRLISIWFELDDYPSKRLDLRKLKELYFEAKKVFFSISKPNELELEEILRIFQKGGEKVNNFFDDWRDGKIQVTDEELNLLEEAFSEASSIINELVKNNLSNYLAEDSRNLQAQIQSRKQIINEERKRRQQIKDLQAQIATIKNQPKNSNNEEKIRNLQEQLNAKKNQENSHFSQNISNAEEKNNSEKGVIGGVIIGVIITICFFLLFILFKKKREKVNFNISERKLTKASKQTKSLKT